MDIGNLGRIKQQLHLSAMGKPALIGIAVVLILVAACAGARVFEAATASEFQLERADASVPSSGANPAAEGRASGQDAPETLFIHVSGEVASPGLCEVPSGSRLADAIREAGGFTEDADPASVNLARPVTDGEQVIVAKKPAEGELPAADGAQAVSPTGAGEGSPPGGTQGSLVNINSATAADLQALPGIGNVLSNRIVADRQANGPFASKEELKRVDGIGEKTYAAIAGAICV